jgi:predicted transcriptional regulator/DNA-binding XRE family transcriptional regulator
MSTERPAYGARVRSLRRREGLSQAQLAQRLGISPSYLNLIEHDRRNLPAPLLVRLAQILKIDLAAFGAHHDARLEADLLEALGDPLFESQAVTAPEVRELAGTSPGMARAFMALYHSYRGARESADNLAARLSGDEFSGLDGSRLPSEEVSDLLQRHMNHFPDLEAGAAELWSEAGLSSQKLYERMLSYLREQHGVEVRVETMAATGGAVRRYDPAARRLTLSELLRRGSRNFQVAYQIGLLTQQRVLDRITRDPLLTTDDSHALARVALASYFASAVLMPYDDFLGAAQAERYDIEVLGHRFRTSFEQVCHRLTTLRRPGREGIPFHFVRVDVAGNISKRFSASGLRFARFSGACPRWVVFSAFLTPGMIRTQLSQMPDGRTFFWVASTVRKDSGGWQKPHNILAVGLGCDVAYAKDMVYADGIDLANREAVVPVGITCRLCERMDCEQRAFPPLQHPLRVQENVRGLSFYAPVES